MMPRICALAGLLLSLALVTSLARAEDSAIANAKARLEAARKVYKWMREGRIWLREKSRWSMESDYQWSRRWLEAERDVSDKKADQVAAAEGHLERMKTLEAEIKGRLKEDIRPVDAATVEFYRLEAEQILAQVRKK